MFVVLCGIGIMGAFILYGWPTAAAKQLTNWDIVEVAGVPSVELREIDNSGKVISESIKIPAEVPDPHEWARERYGEQRTLTREDLRDLPHRLTTEKVTE